MIHSQIPYVIAEQVSCATLHRMPLVSLYTKLLETDTSRSVSACVWNTLGTLHVVRSSWTECRRTMLSMFRQRRRAVSSNLLFLFWSNTDTFRQNVVHHWGVSTHCLENHTPSWLRRTQRKQSYLFLTKPPFKRSPSYFFSWGFVLYASYILYWLLCTHALQATLKSWHRDDLCAIGNDCWFWWQARCLSWGKIDRI